MEKVAVRYLGGYGIIFSCPGFRGEVNNGQTINVSKNFAENELKMNKNWELITSPEPKKENKIEDIKKV